MEFYKNEDGTYEKLKQHNVDTGMGLERITMLLQGKETPFDTELFKPVMDKMKELSKKDNIESRRIAAEHLRASIMVVCDGGRPSNIERFRSGVDRLEFTHEAFSREGLAEGAVVAAEMTEGLTGVHEFKDLII